MDSRAYTWLPRTTTTEATPSTVLRAVMEGPLFRTIEQTMTSKAKKIALEVRRLEGHNKSHDIHKLGTTYTQVVNTNFCG